MDVNKQISDLKKQLRESCETISILQQQQEEFLNLATHDLQSPLRKLETFIDQLWNNLPQDTVVSGYIDKINSTIAHMRYMINSAESLVNIGTAIFERNSLTSVINELKAEKRLSESQIETKNLPEILIGREHLKIIFEELINNSVKFLNPEKEFKITINSSDIIKENLLEISYLDNGIGIKTENINSIFNPFIRLNGAKYPGAGLGLSKIKKIISLYNGTISAIDFVGSGSYFKIYLPLALKTNVKSFKNQNSSS